MKRLMLLRHAKSSWREPGLPDIDRPLNERGLRDAPACGERLRARNRLPQRIFSSPARRALATAERVAAACAIPRGDIEVVEALYEASTETWLSVIGGLPAALDSVLLVGHNPELTALVNLLCAELRLDNLPTCGLMQLDYAIRDWGAVAGSQPADWLFDSPKHPAP